MLTTLPSISFYSRRRQFAVLATAGTKQKAAWQHEHPPSPSSAALCFHQPFELVH